mmetsp:Transcript_19170/g.36702  ORF Transcript_19170/g.36702 Transcript_19170/m.36702 type:complete len:283 (+) Transcript_19170:321-1169(+)
MFSQADVDKRERLLKLFDVQGSASVDIKLIERLLQRCEAVCSHLAQLLEQLFQHFLLVFQQSLRCVEPLNLRSCCEHPQIAILLIFRHQRNRAPVGDVLHHLGSVKSRSRMSCHFMLLAEVVPVHLFFAVQVLTCTAVLQQDRRASLHWLPDQFWSVGGVWIQYLPDAVVAVARRGGDLLVAGQLGKMVHALRHRAHVPRVGPALVVELQPKRLRVRHQVQVLPVVHQLVVVRRSVENSFGVGGGDVLDKQKGVAHARLQALRRGHGAGMLPWSRVRVLRVN